VCVDENPQAVEIMRTRLAPYCAEPAGRTTALG
jgi:hypothetical protein